MIAREETLDSHELLTIKFPIIDSDGTLAGVGGIEVDITERKEVERAFKDARDDAEAANRAKSTFLANMSHELRTPLNSVIGFSDSLLSGTLGDLDNELHREYIGIISSAGNYLLELINDILDLSRIESGHVELDESIFGVKSIITSAITFSQDRHAEKPLAIQNLTSETLPQVRADQRQIRQVMINLITNAIKFTPSGGEITISCDITPHGELEISVSDTGMGISPEDLERVTQPFVQVADSMTRQHEGTGLGVQFLKHIERCKSLLHLIDITNNDLEEAYHQVKNELKNYSPDLLKKRELIVLNKTDLIDEEQAEEIKDKFSKKINGEVLTLSTFKKESVSKIKAKLISYVS